MLFVYLYLANPERSTFFIASSSGVALATLENAPKATKAAKLIFVSFIFSPFKVFVSTIIINKF